MLSLMLITALPVKAGVFSLVPLVSLTLLILYSACQQGKCADYTSQPWATVGSLPGANDIPSVGQDR